MDLVMINHSTQVLQETRQRDKVEAWTDNNNQALDSIQSLCYVHLVESKE